MKPRAPSAKTMSSVGGGAATSTPGPEAATADRLRWFTDARFGMSLHYGLYSVAGRGEWVRSVERLTVRDYQPYFDSFNPEPGCCRAWAQAARVAGARYLVLTTKHHDGFCLFDSGLTTYSAPHTPARRDLVREFVDACREEGLRVGLYYSLVDWHHPDYGPVYGDRQHPLRHDPAQKARDRRRDWSRYVAYMHGQVEELLTRYGRIDLLVFDFSYWDFCGERWGATDLMRMIRRLQPDILVNDRLGFEPLKQSPPPPWAGDYDQCEQNIPREPVRARDGRAIPWEAWFTLSNSWSHNALDGEYKSAATVIRALVNCVSKNGNLCLNVAADPRGRLDAATLERLREIGEWMSRNGESIYGCGAADLPKPEWGRFTQRDRYLYAHLLEPVIGHINLPGLRGRVKNGRLLSTGAEVLLCDYWNPGVQTFDGPDDIFFNFGRPVQFTYALPDSRDTVVRFEWTTPEEREELLRRYRRDYERAIARKPF